MSKTLTTFEALKANETKRVRLIQRHSAKLWVSEYEHYDKYFHGLPYRNMDPSCFSMNDDGTLAPKFAEHIASHAAFHSRGERTVIVGWFA